MAALCQRDQELAVVDLDLEPLESELEKSGVGNGDDLGIRQGGAGADDIGVALVELAVAAPLGTLGAPDFVYLVALERPAEILVHREHPGQRHGQVVAQSDLALAAIKESIEEGIGLFAGLAGEGLGVLEGRRGEGLEAEPLEHVGGGSNDALGEAHPVRQ